MSSLTFAGLPNSRSGTGNVFLGATMGKLPFSESILDGIELNIEAVKQQLRCLKNELGLPNGDSAYGTRRSIRRQLSILHENHKLLKARHVYALETIDEMAVMQNFVVTERAQCLPVQSSS